MEALHYICGVGSPSPNNTVSHPRRFAFCKINKSFISIILLANDCGRGHLSGREVQCLDIHTI
jgi:hypothetical protein